MPTCKVCGLKHDLEGLLRDTACYYCGGKEFASESEFRSHLKRKHPGTIAHAHLELVEQMEAQDAAT